MATKVFIILSLNHSTPDEAIFWRADDAGYTKIPWAAGIYTEEQVNGNPAYYNDGYNTIAIELSNDAIFKAGLKISFNKKKLTDFIAKNKHKKAATNIQKGGSHD
jgi:hypothetical protein